MRPEDCRTVEPLVVAEIVTLPTEIDVNNASRLGHELKGALAEAGTVLIADMSLTEFCDSFGFRHLVIAGKEARVRGVELRLVVQSPAVLKVMQTLGIGEVLKVYASMMAALSAAPTPWRPSP